MHPAPSVILFTVLSGLGFGDLALLGLGVVTPAGGAAFAQWGLGYALAVGGLLASTLHLGQPRRAFSQWRSSWLAREAWASVASLVVLAPMALSDGLGAGLAVATLGCTAMIYAQLRRVPRWNHWLTPALLAGFAASGGAILAQTGALAVFCRGRTCGGPLLRPALRLDWPRHPLYRSAARARGSDYCEQGYRI